MRPPISVSQPGFEKRAVNLIILIFLGGFMLLLSGCAEDTVDEAADCQVQLDSSNFQVVADSAGCSGFARGSAELSLSGFSFETIMKDGSSSDYPTALNLTAAGCATPTPSTDALIGSYDSTYQQKYLRAQYWTRTKPQTDSVTRSNAEIEISFFATLGEIITETHCQIDTDLNGTISDTENRSFTKINIGSSAVGTSDLNSATNLYQIVSSSVPWLCDSSSDVCRKDLTYEGVWANADSGAAPTYTTLLGTPSNISAISAIVRVESLQQLFDPAATTADINKPYTFLSWYSNRANLLLADLTSLGVKTSDDIYTNVNDSVGKMDNGGTCSNSSTQVLDLMTTIVQKAAPQTSAASLPTTKYQTYNELTTAEIAKIDTAETALTCTVCSAAGVTLKARLIYKIDGSTDTGLYRIAAAGIKNTLSNLATLTLDSSNNLIPIAAGDEKVSLKELLCQE